MSFNDLRQRLRRKSLQAFISLYIFLIALCPVSYSQAQTSITSDGTLNTIIAPDGNVFDISGGTRPGNGANLFHSFDRFNLGTGDIARFLGPVEIENIMGRVTGGDISSIDGMLQSTIDGANLFLLNPSGILFGPNASLDVSGSFHASTADALHFADGTVLSSHLGPDATLTIAPPAAFGFLGANPAGIAVLGGSLQVPEGETLSMVGGDIAIVGNGVPDFNRPTLAAAGGQIYLASVASVGEVALDTTDEAPQLDANAFDRLGTVAINQGALVDVSHFQSGTITIRGGRLQVDNSFLFSNMLGDVDGADIGIDVDVTEDVVMSNSRLMTRLMGGAGRIGSIRLSASDIELNNASLVLSQVDLGATGGRGDITVMTDRLSLHGGAQILSRTFGSGQGGTVTVTASESLLISGLAQAGNFSSAIASVNEFIPVTIGAMPSLDAASHDATSASHAEARPPQIQATTGAANGAAGALVIESTDMTVTGGAQVFSITSTAGSGGQLTIKANQLTISEGAGIQTITNAEGAGGQLAIEANQLTISEGAGIQSTTNAGGLAGGILVEAEQLTLREGALIRSSASGSTTGGTIMITATESISIVGSKSNPNLFSGIVASSTSSAQAGSVAIKAQGATVEMESRGVVLSFSAESGGTGPIEIEAQHLTLQDTSVILNLSSGGPTGNVAVDMSGTISIAASSLLGSLSQAGEPGVISLNATTLNLSDRGIIGAPGLILQTDILPFSIPPDGRAGDINIEVENLTAQNRSLITTSTQTDDPAGQVRVEARYVTLSGGARILSNSMGAGQGGNVTVIATDSVIVTGRSADGLFPSGIFASADGRGERAGAGGTVVVEANQITIADGALISSGSIGGGRGGTLALEATDSITVTGRSSNNFQSALTSTAEGDGHAGRILISAPLLTIDDGNILTRTVGRGDAGDIDIDVERLIVTSGGQIFSGTQAPIDPTRPGAEETGRGGDLRVMASDAIFIDGRSTENFRSGLFGEALFGTGDAGDLFVSTSHLEMTDTGTISASTGSASTGNAGRLTVEVDTLTLSGGAQIQGDTFGAGNGGNVRVNATSSITMTGRGPEDVFPFPSGIFATAQGRGEDAGDAGSLFVSTLRLDIGDGAVLGASSLNSTGDAGDIEVDVDTLFMHGNSRLEALTTGAGNGGSATITASESIILMGDDRPGLSSRIATDAFGIGEAAGDAGDLIITASLLRIERGIVASSTVGDANAGDIDVRVDRLELIEGGQLFNGTGSLDLIDGELVFTGTDGPGRGGDLNVVATESILISGRERSGLSSGIFSSTQTGTGRAGDLFVSAPRLDIRDGAEIGANSIGRSVGDAGNLTVEVGELFMTSGARIAAVTVSEGAGGTVIIRGFEGAGHVADSVTIQGAESGLFTSAAGGGASGNIEVSARTISLHDGATISAQSAGAGRSGNIRLTEADTILLNGNSAVTTQAALSDGGNIEIIAQRMVRLQDSQMTTTVSSGEGAGGNIVIDPQFVILGNSQITANAEGGPGGNIAIAANVLLLDPDSRITASSARNVDGEIDIRAPVTNLSGLVTSLTPDFASAAALLQNHCSPGARESTRGRFVVRGRTRVPSPPGGVLPSQPYRPQLEQEQPSRTTGRPATASVTHPLMAYGCHPRRYR